MAWKGKKRELPQFSKLQAQLVDSGLQTDNNPLYHVNKELIAGAQSFKDELDNTVKITDKINLTRQVTGLLSPNNGGTFNGSYFPNVVGLANVTTVNVFYTLFSVASRQIRVDGKLNILPTAALTLTQLTIEMPIHSKFSDADQLQGLINGIPLGAATEGFAGIIIGDTSNGQGRIQFYPQNTDNHDCRFSINYELV